MQDQAWRHYCCLFLNTDNQVTSFNYYFWIPLLHIIEKTPLLLVTDLWLAYAYRIEILALVMQAKTVCRLCRGNWYILKKYDLDVNQYYLILYTSKEAWSIHRHTKTNFVGNLLHGLHRILSKQELFFIQLLRNQWSINIILVRQ